MKKSANPYGEAWAAHNADQLNATFTKKLLAINLYLVVIVIACIVLIGALTYKVAHPPVRYFATEQGRIVPIIPTNAPAFSNADVVDFGNNLIRQAFTLDFLHYKAQMNALQDTFSSDGFKSYYAAITHSNVLTSIKDQRMNLSVMTSTGTVVSEGLVGSRYAWKIQYPVTLSLQGQTSSLPAQQFIVQLLVVRTDVTQKPAGLEVAQLITYEAPPQ